MSDNLKYGLMLGALVSVSIAFSVYVMARQDECEEIGATLVRKPIGIGWDCVATVSPR